MSHLVVCAAQLEAEDGLKIFAFKEDVAFEPVAQVCGIGEGSFLDHFVDARGENESEILLADHVRTASRNFKQEILDNTSGCPFGRRKASGIDDMVFDFAGSVGVDPYAAYSVRA